MWEVNHKSPRGRTSMRKYILAATTFLVASFGYLFASVTPVQAVTQPANPSTTPTATWVDENHITYDGITYQGHYEKTASGDWLNNQIDIPNGSIYYWAKVQTQAKQEKLYLLYFDAKDNFLTASSLTYFSYDVTPNNPATTSTLSNPSARVAVSISPRAPPAAATGVTSCAVDGGMAWIICPITRTLAGFMDKIYSLISQFLVVQPLSTTNLVDNPMYIAWGYMRNFANLAFIIAFLVIIYSQLTNVGMSNYGLKKILPRIIVSAILVNVSYWIATAAVDIANILGYGIQDMFVSVRDSLVKAGGNTFDPTQFTAAGIADLVLGGGTVLVGAGVGGYLGITALTAAAAGGFLGLVGIFLPMLLGLLFIVLVSFLILAARQAIIIILVVLAPLAFVAYLLPNTEKWFERWRETFVTLLIVFPGFSVVFGGSQLAAALIIQGATGANAPVMILLAWGVQLAPLAITPLLLKLGGGVLNRFAGIVNDRSKGVFDRSKNWANERRDEAIARGHRRIAAMENRGELGRFGARRMAYNRQRTKMEREGEKAANESLTKGYFSQTAAGRRVSTLDKRAHLEQEIGDNESEAAWNQGVWNTPRLRNRALRAHDAHERSGLYKKRLDAEASEHWQHTLDHNVALNTINTQSHLAEGRAKLSEDARTNAAELALRQQISTTGGLRDLSINSQALKSQAELFQKDVDAAAKENWANILAATPNLRLMNRESIVAEGRADIQMEGMQAEANRALQWQVNQNVGGLRDVKVAQTVDSSMADFFAKNVEAEGKRTYQTEFVSGRNAAQLNQIAEATVSSEKEATVIENTVQKNAEAAWDDFSRTNQRIQGLRLEETTSVEAAKLAEQQWNNLIRDAQAGSDKDLTAANKSYAQTLKDLSEEAAVETEITSRAEYVKQLSMAKRFRYDEALRNRAGGVDPAGASKVYAKSTETMTKQLMDDTSAAKSVLSNEGYSLEELFDVYQKGVMRDGKEATTEERYAAMQQVGLDKGNNWSFQKLIEWTGETQGMKQVGEKYYDAQSGDEITDQKEIDSRRDTQQILADIVNRSNLNVSWLSGTDRGALQNGTFSYSSAEAVLRDLREEKYKPERIARMNFDELQRMVQVLRDANEDDLASIDDSMVTALTEAIDEALTNDNLKGLSGSREKKVMESIKKFAEDPHHSATSIDEKMPKLEKKIPSVYSINRPHDKTTTASGEETTTDDEG